MFHFTKDFVSRAVRERCQLLNIFASMCIFWAELGVRNAHFREMKHFYSGTVVALKLAIIKGGHASANQGTIDVTCAQ
jgi:hypothetical protein